MKRVVIELVAALCVLVGLADPGAPAGQRQPVEPAHMVNAIVILSRQAELAGDLTRSRAQRRAAAERTLRATATESQRAVMDLLGHRLTEGLVSRVVPLWIVNGVSITATPGVLQELARRNDVRGIQPELEFEAPPNQVGTTSGDAPGVAESNVALVGAPQLWDLGWRGQNVVVASMDTGVDVSHPDLASRWRGGTNSWYDPYGEHPAVPTDVNGHGTSTMGVMIGGDAGGTAIGMAPEASWIAVKMFNDRGVATSTGVHLGYQWLLDPDGNPDTPDAPDVVNNSWNMSSTSCSNDFQPDLTVLRAGGILPVFSAGNYGPSPTTVLSPANSPQAFAVGATDDSDVIDPGSSRGPSTCGQVTAPRITAPGVGVRTADLYASYVDASGTSLAAPHASGALALLLSAFPELDAERQASALDAGAVDLGEEGPDNTYGSGRLDVLESYQWLATSPDMTVAMSPATATVVAGGSSAFSLTVVGVNGFVDDVSFALTGLAGTSASWTFTPEVVAAGNGETVLSVVTADSMPSGVYPLTVTATGGSEVRQASATLMVSPRPDFTEMVSPASRTVASGASTTYTVTIGSQNGFASTVGLSVTGLPANVGSAILSPAAVVTAGTSTLQVTTTAAAPAGTYALSIVATSGPIAHVVTVQLVTASDFALSVSPSSTSVPRRQTAVFSVSVSAIGGFSGSVAFTIAGVPAGASASVSPNPRSGPGIAQLTIRTTSSTPRGTYPLTITATSGGLVHQAVASLTVR